MACGVEGRWVVLGLSQLGARGMGIVSKTSVEPGKPGVISTPQWYCPHTTSRSFDCQQGRLTASTERCAGAGRSSSRVERGLGGATALRIDTVGSKWFLVFA